MNPPPRPFRLAAGVTALAAALRLAALAAPLGAPTAMFPDETQFWDMASGWAAGHGLRDELGFHVGRMPLYPAFLRLFAPDGQSAARIVQALLGAVAAGLAAGLAATLSRAAPPTNPVRDRIAAVIAGVLVAADPYLVFFSRFLLTETLFTTALVGLAWAWSAPRQRRAALALLFAPLCVYLRPSAALLVLALALGAIWIGGSRRSALGVVGVLAFTVLTLVPWAVRNQQLTGHWTWLTHRFGISLYDGVGPQATGTSDLGDIKAGPEVAALVAAGDEVGWNAHFSAAAWAACRADPSRVARLAVTKVRRTWWPWPSAAGFDSPLIRAVGTAWMALFVLGVPLGVWTTRRAAPLTMLLLLPAFYFTALHALFVGSLRYRLPAMPLLAVLVAVGAAAWWARRSGKASHSNICC